MQTLQQPDHIHTQIVDSFGISIKGQDFATLQAKEMLPRIGPHLPRCYYVSSHWFSKLTEDGRANHQKVARWTLGVNVFQDYDVILIPIIHNYHWYLGTIDFTKKVTTVLDSLELSKTADKKTPARPETHEDIMTWLDGEHRRITTTSTTPGRPLDRLQWRVINASDWVGKIPRQGDPGQGVGVDCGLFTLAFAMELSLGRKTLEVQQTDILAIRNWITHTMLHYGKQNGTSELDTPFLSRILSSIGERRTSPTAQFSLKRKAPVILGLRGKIGRSEQKETDSAAPVPPRHVRLRDLRNQGGTCAIIVVLQACFQVPQLASLLELTAHPQLDSCRSLLTRYREGSGPLSVGTMTSLIPSGLRPRTGDTGEIMTDLFTLFGIERSIFHLPPADTLLSTVRQTRHVQSLPPPDAGGYVRGRG
jgi:hypothetical protein